MVVFIRSVTGITEVKLKYGSFIKFVTGITEVWYFLLNLSKGSQKDI